MIFAAGTGSRLKPITDTMPKALVVVNGKPLLEHVILKLKNAGFDEIIVNVHHFARQIIEFLQDNKNFNIRMHISDESDALLETGGGIKKAAAFFDDGNPFLVHNVDILSDVNLDDMYRCAVKNEAVATLLVSERLSSRYLLFDRDNKLCGWMNALTKETKSPYRPFHPADYRKLAFSGIHVMKPDIFQWMKQWTGRFSVIDFYLAVCRELPIHAYTPDNLRWLDVGKPDALQKAAKFLS
jgi:NDP-sugar pyrophosphorylase family protein